MSCPQAKYNYNLTAVSFESPDIPRQVVHGCTRLCLLRVSVTTRVSPTRSVSPYFIPQSRYCSTVPVVKSFSTNKCKMFRASCLVECRHQFEDIEQDSQERAGQTVWSLAAESQTLAVWDSEATRSWTEQIPLCY